LECDTPFFHSETMITKGELRYSVMCSTPFDIQTQMTKEKFYKVQVFSDKQQNYEATYMHITIILQESQSTSTYSTQVVALKVCKMILLRSTRAG